MIKQVIVMRADLGMRKGKMIAQGAHASMKVFLDQGLITTRLHEGRQTSCLEVHGLTSAMVAWIEGLFTKVCVRVESEAELLDLRLQAQQAGLPVALIEDAGKTEFHGVVTPTCIAIGPAEAEDIDKITGHLKLL